MLFKILFLTLIFLLTTSFTKQKEDELYLNYVVAAMHQATFQYYLAIKIMDINTGLKREICTQGNFLQGALHIEYNLDYDYDSRARVDSILKSNKERYFEFKNAEAIQNLRLSRYSMQDLETLEHKINFDSLAKKIKKSKKWDKWTGDDKTTFMYAHALFNRGIMTGESNCYGGTLYYIDRNNPIH